MSCLRPRRSSERGFTLLELMIVVVIVAVLAAVAVVAYIRHIRSSRLVQAKAFLANIQAYQETYFQRFGQYHDTGSAGAYPGTIPTGEAVAWNPAPGTGWRDLGVQPEGGVTYFRWEVRASSPTNTHAKFDSAAALGISQVTAGTPIPWYYIRAEADLDSAGGTNTVIYATSQRAEPVSYDEGS